MRDLDQLLSASTGRDVAARAADAARGSDADDLSRRGARRGRRNRALAVAGVAAATAVAVGLGFTVLGGDLGAERRPPTDRPSQGGPPSDPEGLSDVRPRDLTPEQVAQLPSATVLQAVTGADLDHRAVVWQAGGRQVLARTTDGGASWDYSGEPGQFFELTRVPGPSDSFWLSVTNGNGRNRSEALIDPAGELVAVTPPEDTAPVAEGEALAQHLPRPNALRQVAVAPDGTSHYWPGDPYFEEQRTGVVGGWESGVQMPTGRIVQQVAGPQESFQGFCCAARPVVRWSDDGGATWSTRDLDDLGADPDAIYPFSLLIPSLDPETVAVHESTEGGSRVGRPLLATQRFAADGSAADRFEGQFPSKVDAAWSVVLPDGGLLVWVDAGRLAGPWLSAGDDWSAMTPADDLAPPSGVDEKGLVLADVRLVDGEARVVAVADSGAMLVLEGDDATWTTVDATD